MNVLHSLHVHPSGFHAIIFTLNSRSELESFISGGTSSNVFGPLYLLFQYHDELSLH